MIFIKVPLASTSTSWPQDIASTLASSHPIHTTYLSTRQATAKNSTLRIGRVGLAHNLHSKQSLSAAINKHMTALPI